MDGKSKKITKKVLLYVLLIILALIWIVPIFTLVVTALKHKKRFHERFKSVPASC